MLSMKKAVMITALLSGTQANWLSRMFKTETDVGPHGEQIIHDVNVDINDRRAILKSETVDLKELR